MERLAGTSARAQRLTSTVALVLLASSTAWAFSRVFQGSGPSWKLQATALGSAAVALLLQRRSLVLATAVSAAVLVVIVGWFVFPSTIWHGVPTLETLHAMARSSHLVTEQARVQSAPTEPLPPLLLASMVALWAAVFSSHALSTRAGSPLLALVPPIALVAFADSVLDVMRPLFGLPFLAAALLMAFTDATRRLQSWGTVWSDRSSGPELFIGAARGARPVAIGVLVVALFSPTFIPAFGSTAVIDLSSSDHRVSIDPFVDIRESLTRQEDLPVAEVESSQPAYLRLLSLDTFDGASWRTSGASGTLQFASQTILPEANSGVTNVQMRISAENDLSYPYLPLPYPASSVQIDGGVKFEYPSATIYPSHPLDKGDTYTVQTPLIEPTPEALEAIGVGPVPTRYLQLPPNLPVAIKQLAEQWAGKDTNNFDRVMSIQEHLRDPAQFQYDDSVPARGDSFSLANFLIETRRGFCQQFSSAMAVMLRTLHIPARIAVGYTAGNAVEGVNDTYEITTKDSHAWVEVWFPSYGWLSFEPTPGRLNPTSAAYSEPATTTCPPGIPGCVDGRPGSVGGSTGGPTPSPVPPGRIQQAPQSGPNGPLPPLLDPPARTRFTWRHGIGLLAVAGVLLLLLVPPGRWTRRRIRLRRAGEPRSLILTTFDVFADRAGELGFPREPGETLHEYGRRLERNGADGRVRREVEQLTSITSRAAYAREAPGEDDARTAGEAAESVIGELRRLTPLAQRVVGQYRRP